MTKRSPEFELIAAERKRQIEVEGYTRERDQRWDRGELVDAGRCYFRRGKGHDRTPAGAVPEDWPWGPERWKEHDRQRCLIIAGALFVAERERLKAKRLSYEHIDSRINKVKVALREFRAYPEPQAQHRGME